MIWSIKIFQQTEKVYLNVIRRNDSTPELNASRNTFYGNRKDLWIIHFLNTESIQKYDIMVHTWLLLEAAMLFSGIP